MAAIFQTTFSNAFFRMKIYGFRLRCHWSLFLRVQLTIFLHWFRYWLGVDQATSHYLNQWWLDYWRIYASLGLNELTASHYITALRWLLHIDALHQTSVCQIICYRVNIDLVPTICRPGSVENFAKTPWQHDGVIKWKHFSRYWPFVRGIHRSPVNSLHKGQWRGALMPICAHYDVIVLKTPAKYQSVLRNFKHRSRTFERSRGLARRRFIEY